MVASLFAGWRTRLMRRLQSPDARLSACASHEGDARILDLSRRDRGSGAAPAVADIVRTAAISASLSFHANDGMPGPVGSFAVATLRAPWSTTRTRLVGSSEWTLGDPASAGKRKSTPLPSLAWQAEHWSA